MSEVLDTALIVVADDDSVVKNSTLGLDSGLASANESNEISQRGGFHLSAFSSIDGMLPPVGKL